jgi:phenylalanyl-tRNA synthetase alpha chain
MTADIKTLHPLEVKVVLSYSAGDCLSAERLEAELPFKSGNGNQALSYLAAKGIVSEASRETSVFYSLSPLGREWQKSGTVEERLAALAASSPGQTLPELAQTLGVDKGDAGSAFGALSKAGVLLMDGDKKIFVVEQGSQGQASSEKTGAVRGLLDKAASSADGMLADADLSDAEKNAMATISKKRGAQDSAFRVVQRERVFFKFTDSYPVIRDALEKAGVSGDELGQLTKEMLETGAWKGKTFRPYSVNVPPSRLLIGRSNPYSSFLEGVKDKLASLGFEEFDGSLVESEFWNSDALFMPQFHAARDIHDAYYIKEPSAAKFIEEPHLSNVAAAHETGGDTGSRGWSYKFDREFTKRLILRSQGTVLSARQLPKAKVPGKYFGIVRCFRYDRVDATHLSDFYQTEGIVLGDDVNLRTLLGFLEMFAVEVAGAKEVKYVPGYFPFTEPSVEVHIKHPTIGWFELGGSGIFRPEVTKSLGVDVPVAAWGIGIDRMALMALGLNDLRELFSPDIESVRLRRAK